MLKYDKKIFRTIKKYTRDLSEPLRFSDGQLQSFYIKDHTIKRFIPVKYDMQLANESVQRLISDGFLRKDIGYFGGFTFCITSKTILSHQFWWDDFTQKFWNGYILGVISGLTVEAIIYYAPSLLYRLSQWMQTLTSFR